MGTEEGIKKRGEECTGGAAAPLYPVLHLFLSKVLRHERNVLGELRHSSDYNSLRASPFTSQSSRLIQGYSQGHPAIHPVIPLLFRPGRPQS